MNINWLSAAGLISGGMSTDEQQKDFLKAVPQKLKRQTLLDIDLDFDQQLSPRLAEVTDLILSGKTNKEIAAELGLSYYTITDYTKQIFKHYTVSNRRELLAAIKNGRLKQKKKNNPHFSFEESLFEIINHLLNNKMNICERRRFFFDNFLPLIGATSYIWYESIFDQKMGSPMILNYLTNFNSSQQSLFFLASNDPQLRDPYMVPSITHRNTKNVNSYLRQECLDDDSWYDSEYCDKYYKEANIDNPLCYMITQEGNQMCGIFIYNKWRDPQFTLEHRRIIESVFRNLPWAFPDQPAINPEPFHELTPQIYRILLFLINGNDKHEVAAYLNISEHTVNDYCKQIYKIFNVKSYAELMKIFLH